MRLYLCGFSFFILALNIFSSDLEIEPLSIDTLLGQLQQVEDEGDAVSWPVLTKRNLIQNNDPAKRTKYNDVEFIYNKSKDFYEKPSEQYKKHLVWLEKNISDENVRFAFVSLFNIKIGDECILDPCKRIPKSLCNNLLICAMSIYLRELAVNPQDIHAFILHVREGINTGNEFSVETIKSFYRDFLKLSDNVANPRQCFRANFSTYMIESFEPHLEKITGKKFSNSKGLNALYAKYKKYNDSQPVYFNFVNPEKIYTELMRGEEEKELREFIGNLEAKEHEKAALLSLVHEPGMLERIRGLPTSLDTNTTVVAICVYLGHFGVQPQHIYSFIIEIRKEKKACPRFSTSTPECIYRNYLKGHEIDYFKRDFSYLMVSLFQPIVSKYVDEGQFQHFSTLSKKYEDYVAQQNEKAIVIIQEAVSLNVDESAYEEIRNKSLQEKADLSAWVDAKFENQREKFVFYSLIVAPGEVGKEGQNLVDIIEQQKGLGRSSHALAAIIFLSHFQIKSEDIYEFFVQLKGQHRVSKKEFAPTTPRQRYGNFVKFRDRNDGPGYLTERTFTKTLSEVFLPIMRDITGDPEANF